MARVEGIKRISRGRCKQVTESPRRFRSTLCIFYELFTCFKSSLVTLVELASILGELALVSLLSTAVSCQRVAEMETAIWWIILVICSRVYWLMIWSSPAIKEQMNHWWITAMKKPSFQRTIPFFWSFETLWASKECHGRFLQCLLASWLVSWDILYNWLYFS